MSELSNLPQLEQLAAQFIKEQRRKRRWGIFFKSIYLLLIIGLLFLFLPDRSENTYKKGKLHVAVIDVQGPIFGAAPASAKNINEALDDAFENKNTVGVILNINSPPAAIPFKRVISITISTICARSIQRLGLRLFVPMCVPQVLILSRRLPIRSMLTQPH